MTEKQTRKRSERDTAKNEQKNNLRNDKNIYREKKKQ